MYITIDPYYDVSFYNECKEALKNNQIDFKTFISIKPPYNWYFQLDQKPVMVNYDELSNTEERWLVNAIQPLRPNEEYILLRRLEDTPSKALLKFVENEPFKEVRKNGYGILFNVTNREEAEKLTREYPGKVWYLGKYYNNKYKVCLASNNIIKNYIDKDQILLEDNGEFKEPGRFESEFNYKILRGKDMLIKFTETPYFENGSYMPVKIRGEISSKFII